MAVRIIDIHIDISLSLKDINLHVDSGRVRVHRFVFKYNNYSVMFLGSLHLPFLMIWVSGPPTTTRLAVCSNSIL